MIRSVSSAGERLLTPMSAQLKQHVLLWCEGACSRRDELGDRALQASQLFVWMCGRNNCEFVGPSTSRTGLLRVTL